MYCSCNHVAPNDSCFTDELIESVVDLDQVLRALSHRRRREILSLLDEQPEWTLHELETRISGFTGSGDPDVEVGLIHIHLPMLEDADVAVHDQESGIVSQGENYTIVREMVDAAADVINSKYVE